MNAEELWQRAEAVTWWHGGMDLGHGVVTKGLSNPGPNLLPMIGLPVDLTGKTVLDIGAWDGFMSFECERQGAAKVVAVDSFAWTTGNPHIVNGTGRAGFDLAHEAYGSKVEPVFCEVLDLDPAELGVFDVVLCLGLLYHMRHPLLALERVAAMTGELLILETHVDMQHDLLPAMRFYPGRELNNDGTNWWGPNAVCVEAMLRDVGFAQVTQVGWSSSWPGMGRVAVHGSR